MNTAPQVPASQPAAITRIEPPDIVSRLLSRMSTRSWSRVAPNALLTKALRLARCNYVGTTMRNDPTTECWPCEHNKRSVPGKVHKAKACLNFASNSEAA